MDGLIGSSRLFGFKRGAVFIAATHKRPHLGNIRPLPPRPAFTNKLAKLLMRPEDDFQYEINSDISGTSDILRMIPIAFVSGKVQCTFVKRVTVISQLGISGSSFCIMGVTPTGGAPLANDQTRNTLAADRKVVVTSGGLDALSRIEIGKVWPLNFLRVTRAACDFKLEFDAIYMDPDDFWNVFFQQYDFDTESFYPNIDVTGPLIPYQQNPPHL